MKILDGKTLANTIRERLKTEVAKGKDKPTLAIIQIGNRPESNVYVGHKKKFGDSIGATVKHIVFGEEVTTEVLTSEIKKLNKNKKVQGIIVQLPIPKHLDKKKIIESIDPGKDVDGLHSVNSASLYESTFGFNENLVLVPATAKGVITMLKEYNIPLEGKRALVVGRSMLVGKPVAMLLLKENATVTIAHSKSKNLKQLCLDSEIIVVAVGSPKIIKKGFFKKGQVIIDVGTNAVVGPKILEEDVSRKLVGDVDFKEASKVVKAVSPVPGGVGPMTVASLFENLVEVACLK